jgi:L-malate glycosyltransferase
MHILLICPEYPNKITPGYGSYVKDQFLALRGNLCEHKIGVLGMNIISIKQFKNIKLRNLFTEKNIQNQEYIYKIIGFPFLKKLNYFLRLLVFKNAFKSYLKKHGKPDLIHVHIFEVGALAIWAKKKYGIPFVFTEHSTGFASNLFKPWQIDLAKSVFFESLVNIAVSQEFKVLLSNRFGIDFIYIPNFVRMDDFIVNSSCEDDMDFDVFTNIGYLNKKKNQRELILAFSKLYKGKNYLLYIGGDGPEYENLMHTIREEEIEKQVTLLGKLSKSEVVELLKKTNYFVLTSKVETFGIVLIEAMAMGIPVLSTKCGGPESIITDDQLGMLCDNNFEAILIAMDEMPKRKFSSEVIRKHIEDNFSEKRVVSLLHEIYQKVINKGKLND